MTKSMSEAGREGKGNEVQLGKLGEIILGSPTFPNSVDLFGLKSFLLGPCLLTV